MVYWYTGIVVWWCTDDFLALGLGKEVSHYRAVVALETVVVVSVVIVVAVQ